MWRHQPYAGEVLLLAIDLPPSSAAAAVIPIRGLGRTVSTLPAEEVANGGRAASIPTEHNRPEE
ncbi:hypothetical protein PGTUg99_036487 [Puccinia graminis f. sp. tritici]|uniref:Uncharacterized protein n=1 Tax=Puccinia graminis f. sp. tritici TaxID=56615 RepID=A0A5B0RNK0_PUCGR|nr:hypothetical protein PGTUg99_036487 [Puccinia graminis f. sp. tritici]